MYTASKRRRYSAVKIADHMFTISIGMGVDGGYVCV